MILYTAGDPSLMHSSIWWTWLLRDARMSGLLAKAWRSINESHWCGWAGDYSQHAAMLAALPDTCAACNAPALRAHVFIPHLVHQLLDGLGLVESSTQSSENPALNVTRAHGRTSQDAF